MEKPPSILVDQKYYDKLHKDNELLKKQLKETIEALHYERNNLTQNARLLKNNESTSPCTIILAITMFLAATFLPKLIK
jgi:hypothetical protein